MPPMFKPFKRPGNVKPPGVFRAKRVPGLAKKPGGLPPGLAKKPGQMPPGQYKKQISAGLGAAGAAPTGSFSPAPIGPPSFAKSNVGQEAGGQIKIRPASTGPANPLIQNRMKQRLASPVVKGVPRGAFRGRGKKRGLRRRFGAQMPNYLGK